MGWKLKKKKKRWRVFIVTLRIKAPCDEQQQEGKQPALLAVKPWPVCQKNKNNHSCESVQTVCSRQTWCTPPVLHRRHVTVLLFLGRVHPECRCVAVFEDEPRGVKIRHDTPQAQRRLSKTSQNRDKKNELLCKGDTWRWTNLLFLWTTNMFDSYGNVSSVSTEAEQQVMKCKVLIVCTHKLEHTKVTAALICFVT